MEHLSLYKNGDIAFTYEEPESINTPINRDSSVMYYLQESVKLERAYSIRDLIMMLKSYPELHMVHSHIDELINISDNKNLYNRDHRLNYLSFEYIHELYYNNDVSSIEETQTYTSVSVFSGMDNEIEENIYDRSLSEIIDLPIIIRSGIERTDNLERIFIDTVSFLCFIYEIVDCLSYMEVSVSTNSQAA